jgi:hypothetical protein
MFQILKPTELMGPELGIIVLNSHPAADRSLGRAGRGRAAPALAV